MNTRTALLAATLTGGATLGWRVCQSISRELFGPPVQVWPRNTREPELFGPPPQPEEQIRWVDGNLVVVERPDGSVRTAKLGLRRLLRGI